MAETGSGQETSDQSLESWLNRATNPSNQKEEWEFIIGFCDQINKELEGPQIACRLIGHKIQSPQEREALQALTVLEASVKNCGQRFHKEIGKFRFLNEMIKIVSPKYLGEQSAESIKSKVIDLLYSWSVGLPHESKIEEAYKMLKKQGVVTQDPVQVDQIYQTLPTPKPQMAEFEDEDKSKLLNRLLKSRHPEDLQAANRLIKNMVKGNSDKMERTRRRAGELETCGNKVKVLGELLAHYQPDRSSPQEVDLIKEMYESCEKMRPNLFRLASDIEENDEAIVDILKANDSLVQVLDIYKKTFGITDENKETSLLDLGERLSQPASSQPGVVGMATAEGGGGGSSQEPSSSSLILEQQLSTLGLGQSQQPRPQQVGGWGDSRMGMGMTSSPSPQPAMAPPPLYHQPRPAPPAAVNVNQSTPPPAAAPVSSQLLPLRPVGTTASTQMGTQQNGLQSFGLGPQPHRPMAPSSGGRLLGQPAPQLNSPYGGGGMAAAPPQPLGPPSTPLQQQAQLPTPTSTVLAAAAAPGSETSFADLDQLGQNLMQQSLNQLNQPKQDPSPKQSPPSQNAAGAAGGSLPVASPGPSVTTVLSLLDIVVPLETIQPGLHASITVYEKNGLKSVFHFGKDAPVGRPDILVVVVSTTSTNPGPITNLVFQAAVPKLMKVKLQPPSASQLPTFNPILPPSAITQVMLVANPNKEKIRLKFKITFTLNDKTVSDVGEVENFPL